MRRIAVFPFLLSLAAAPFAWSAAPTKAQPATAEKMLERCKAAPDICKAIAVAQAAALAMKGEACIPNNVSKDDIAERVTGTAEEIVEEVPDSFKDADYTVLMDQIILFVWNCAEHPIS